MIHPEDTQTQFDPVHVDKRKLPRVVLRTPASVIGPSGEKFSVTVRDVSPDGLQMRCTRAVAARIHPSGRAIRDGEAGVHVEVTFAAPTDDGRVVVTLLCRVAYLSIIAPEVVAIGLVIVGAAQASRARLEQVFARAMRPREDARPPAPRQIKGAGDRLLVRPRGHGTAKR